MDLETFELIKNKYGLIASWAIWGEEGDTPKSNMGDLSVFDLSKNTNLLNQLNPNIILVALNFSYDVPENELRIFANFHGKGGGAYKLRYGLRNTVLWGAYITDIIKNFPEMESANVMKYLKNNPEFVKENIITFEEELNDLGATDPIIVALGGDTYKILSKNLNPKYKIFRTTHYSHYISKENYRTKIYEDIVNKINL